MRQYILAKFRLPQDIIDNMKFDAIAAELNKRNFYHLQWLPWLDTRRAFRVHVLKDRKFMPLRESRGTYAPSPLQKLFTSPTSIRIRSHEIPALPKISPMTPQHHPPSNPMDDLWRKKLHKKWKMFKWVSTRLWTTKEIGTNIWKVIISQDVGHLQEQIYRDRLEPSWLSG